MFRLSLHILGNIKRAGTTGNQNVFLTGNPKKTFFKAVYAKHTNFGLQKFRIDFNLRGSSNYAFNLIMRDKNERYAKKLMKKLQDNNIEFRRGSAGGGNQLRQPYLKNYVKKNEYKKYPVTDHIHFFGFYIGNYPDLKRSEIEFICKTINDV